MRLNDSCINIYELVWLPISLNIANKKRILQFNSHLHTNTKQILNNLIFIEAIVLTIMFLPKKIFFLQNREIFLNKKYATYFEQRNKKHFLNIINMR